MSIKNNAIQGLKPRDKPYRVAVGNSLFLLVTPNGSKLWQYRYRFEGRVNILSFGPYPFVTLLQARIQRDAARLKLIQGINPAKKKESAIRFSSIVEQWFKANAVDAAKPWAKTTARKIRIYLDKDVLPALGKRPVTSIQRTDLIKLTSQLEARGAFDPANKMRHWLVGIFDLVTWFNKPDSPVKRE
ncbi:prophage integrase IntS [Nitrosomonas stercoris]|uniref:Prophage integrase IntS n=1 Tax=Nitrosomonas stercoris TaxID=1444684 RepID=A0A4Y1YS68_9PROT|nr:prophage integrase IntS [Nitrosomonas stercoris]